MGKPSIFSNDYEQRMRKRKKMTIINLILFILILISAVYFGSNYYMENSNINLGSIFKSFKKDIDKKQNQSEQSDKTKTKGDTSNSQNNEPEQTVEKTNSYFEYKASDGKTYRLEYTEASGKKQYTGVKSDTGDVEFDLSSDGRKVLFCTLSGDVVIGDDQGTIKKINSDSYRSKSAGITIEKKTTMQYYPEYVWAAKPHFTSDNRVVYVSYLPYLKGANTFYMWILSIDGASQKMAGKLTNDIGKISYDGFSSDGALRIKVNDNILYLPAGGYSLTK